MARRQPVKPLNPSAESVQANAAAERARKAASKKALKASKPSADPTPVQEADRPVDHSAEYAANALAAARVDADALGVPVEQVLADMGLGADGRPLPVKQADRPKYSGPMLALRSAAKGYVTGANGNPHCGDMLAQALAGATREQIVVALIRAMKLDGNPYLHLNAGQQSMNLRNKARAMLKTGALRVQDVTDALQQPT